jgi:hypothetical protein
MSQTVYAVSQGSYSGYHIEGIYSTRERAQQYIDYCKAAAGPDGFYDEQSIEEYILDEHTTALERSQSFYWVRIRTSGEVIEVSKEKPSSWRENKLVSEPFENNGKDSHLLFELWADDVTHAVKQASDLRAAWIGSGRCRLV